MPVTQSSLEPQIPVAEVERLVDEYLVDCEYRGHKKHTIASNRSTFNKLFWFLRFKGHEAVGKQELKQFLHYLQQDPGQAGRWGNPKETKLLRPITVRDYHRCLATFFNWLVEEEVILLSPMRKVKAPSCKKTQKEPLARDQVKALLEACKVSPSPRRDEAIVLMLLDTGLRAAELCNLKIKDMDFKNRSAKVVGKGNKIRMTYWGIGTARALARYLRHQDRHSDDSVFTSDKGTLTGCALTPSGLYQIMTRLGRIAGVKCGCHDWRRTCAVSLLRNGANLISVQRLLGHETLEITRGYLALAEADIENQHREHSPVDCMK